MTTNQNWKFPFFTIATGQAVSLIGSSAVQFALIWWLAEQTGSPMIMGMAGLVSFLPMTILSPFAGVAVDRYSRKWICIGADLFTAALALIYALLIRNFHMPVWTVAVILCLRGMGGTFQQPAISAIIPQLVPQEELVRANGWLQLLNSGSFILGPVIGAALYAAVPMWVVLLTDVAGALFASGALLWVKILALPAAGQKAQGFAAQFCQGMEVYSEDKKLFMIVIAEALCMFFYAPLSTFYPLMTSDFFNLPAIYGGIVETGFAVGMMGAALLFGSVWKVKRKIAVSYIGLAGLGVTSAICGLLPPIFAGWLIFAGTCLLMGAFGNVHSIPLIAYMQETIAPEKMGRAFSLMALIGSLSMPVGLLIASPIAEKVGVRAWFLVSGIGMMVIVSGILGINWMRKSNRKTAL